MEEVWTLSLPKACTCQIVGWRNGQPTIWQKSSRPWRAQRYCRPIPGRLASAGSAASKYRVPAKPDHRKYLTAAGFRLVAEIEHEQMEDSSRPIAVSHKSLLARN